MSAGLTLKAAAFTLKKKNPRKEFTYFLMSLIFQKCHQVMAFVHSIIYNNTVIRQQFFFSPNETKLLTLPSAFQLPFYSKTAS